MLIKSNSITGINISRSLQILDKNLKEHFTNDLQFLNVFGSYTRGTILPRQFDKNSDIDILIGFHTGKSKLRPESYRDRLLKFAFKYYPTAKVMKDHPSIVIELNHINFDLVPGIFDTGIFYNSFEIPDKDGGWMETEPEKFNKKLTDANTSHNSIVKPIIRFLKAWNAHESYPYYSYDLESAIVEMNFSGDTFASGFLYAIENLPTYELPNVSSKKVDVLRNNAKWIREYVEREDLAKAKDVVRRIIPVGID
ncbi:hypothetical protein DQQ10_05310 [Pseudochryseolinea flava]|uniref:Nucleotidyltransferase n=1 Tax=Pseudochryseolinea flava TaxID=2059302 RepID=A0A364Y4Q6_9BACT|nr:hypothetical protein DQQ10_05310 [Pseudochryseolinea flava]